MDMNNEESVQYVAMKELSYADIEPAVYETPYTPPGDACSKLYTGTGSVLCEYFIDCMFKVNIVKLLWKKQFKWVFKMKIKL